LTYREGNKVIYPRLGVCRVDGVVEQNIAGSPVRFYSLKPVEQDSANILVPVNKAEEIGVRRLIDRAAIPKLLRFLGKDVEVASDHRKRSARNAERLSSGEIFKVADSVKAMTKLGKGKNLSFEEQQTLARARHLLVKELAFVTKLSTDEVEEIIDGALAGKRMRTKKIAA
jgi:CarD family transcriptional regulator